MAKTLGEAQFNARAQAFEEAAQVAEAPAVSDRRTVAQKAAALRAEIIAAAIRALVGK